MRTLQIKALGLIAVIIIKHSCVVKWYQIFESLKLEKKFSILFDFIFGVYSIALMLSSTKMRVGFLALTIVFCGATARVFDLLELPLFYMQYDYLYDPDKVFISDTA